MPPSTTLSFSVVLEGGLHRSKMPDEYKGKKVRGKESAGREEERWESMEYRSGADCSGTLRPGSSVSPACAGLLDLSDEVEEGEDGER